MIILGLNAYHSDSSAALVTDGSLSVAIAEERLNRRKHAGGFPVLAMNAVLNSCHVSPAEVDHFAVSRNPRAHWWQKTAYVTKNLSRCTKLVIDRWANGTEFRAIQETIAQAVRLPPNALRAKLHNVEHHLAHMASAFFVSPFEEAACLSIDGSGDFVSTMFGVGRDRVVKEIDAIQFPHSAGMFYTALTQFLGFREYGEEWKVMGLAPYGKPLYVNELRELVALDNDGGFRLDLDYFRHDVAITETGWDGSTPGANTIYSGKLLDLLGNARDPAEVDVFGKWADIAASTQTVYEELLFHVLRELHRRTRIPRLALAGGCALNSVANGKILEHTPFRELFVPAAPADDGTAIGAAYYVQHMVLDAPRAFVMLDAYTGTSFSDTQVAEAIGHAVDRFSDAISVRRYDDEELCNHIASALASGQVVGWFQGRMEFGPRALGNRSILADPRRPEMTRMLNQRVKCRETFRPFAPSVLEERCDEIFEKATASPFMSSVYKVRESQRSRVPAITHVDGTARIQTVNARTNPRFHSLISEFSRLTGVPVVLNTSFNVREPIVATPENAIDCYLRSEMDILAIGNWVMSRPSTTGLGEPCA